MQPRRRQGGPRPVASPVRFSARNASAGAAENERKRSGRVTSRAAVLGLVVCAMVLTLAFPVRELLGQRAEMARLHEAQQQTNTQIDADRKELAQWQDPAYVRAQATKRLQYVKPGDTAYVVLGQPKSAADSGDKNHAVVPRTEAKDSPWYSQLWSTVRAADGK